VGGFAVRTRPITPPVLTHLNAGVRQGWTPARTREGPLSRLTPLFAPAESPSYCQRWGADILVALVPGSRPYIIRRAVLRVSEGHRQVLEVEPLDFAGTVVRRLQMDDVAVRGVTDFRNLPTLRCRNIQ